MSKAYQGCSDTIPYTINGIPCQIGVLTYYHQEPFKGSAWNCDSDMDYYGYDDIEWTVLDRKGYYAGWLESKLSDSDKDDIRESIIEYYKNKENIY